MYCNKDNLTFLIPLVYEMYTFTIHRISDSQFLCILLTSEVFQYSRIVYVYIALYCFVILLSTLNWQKLLNNCCTETVWNSFYRPNSLIYHQNVYKVTSIFQLTVFTGSNIRKLCLWLILFYFDINNCFIVMYMQFWIGIAKLQTVLFRKKSDEKVPACMFPNFLVSW